MVSAAEFDASLLEQDRLDMVAGTQETKIYPGNFNSLIQGKSFRKNTSRGGINYEYCMAKEVTVTIVLPQDAKVINQNESINLVEVEEE
jgi:hypothetical protein